MDPSESEVSDSTVAALTTLVGGADTPNPVVRAEDILSLPDDEKVAELANKEQAARINLRMCKQLLKQLKEEHELRKKFMPYVYWLVVGVLAATFVILIISGCVRACGHKFLSDKVLIAILTGTVIDIIGILYIAVRWLFRQPKK